MDLDRLDLKILAELHANARLSHVELSERIGLSATAIARRQKALESEGFIQAYHADLDIRLFGYQTTVLIRITLDSQSDAALRAFEMAATECPSIIRCFFVSGADDYLAIVVAKDLQDYERIHRTELSRLPGIAKLQSSFALREVPGRTLPPAIFAPLARSSPKGKHATSDNLNDQQAFRKQSTIAGDIEKTDTIFSPLPRFCRTS